MSVSDLPRDLIGAPEAARIARCHVSAVYRWVMAGKLRGWRRAGRRYLVSRADVEALLRPVAVAPQPPAHRTPAQRLAAAEAAMEELRAMGVRC